MAKPDGIKTGKKDNSKKHPYQREQWIKSKREGRTKQQWVHDMDGVLIVGGHWEKIPQ